MVRNCLLRPSKQLRLQKITARQEIVLYLNPCKAARLSKGFMQHTVLTTRTPWCDLALRKSNWIEYLMYRYHTGLNLFISQQESLSLCSQNIKLLFPSIFCIFVKTFLLGYLISVVYIHWCKVIWKGNLSTSKLEDRIVKKSQAKKPHKDWSERGVGPLRTDVFRKGNNFEFQDIPEQETMSEVSYLD